MLENLLFSLNGPLVAIVDQSISEFEIAEGKRSERFCSVYLIRRLELIYN